MPSWAWILLWVVLLAGVAVLYVREKRSGRRIGDVDRQRHQAVRDAELDARSRGPFGGAETWF